MSPFGIRLIQSVRGWIRKHAISFFLYNKKPTDIIISKFILVRNSTCFGQFLCPSSGVIDCTFGNGKCYTGLMTACVKDQDPVSGSFSVHPQELSTVRSAMANVIHVWRQPACRILILHAGCHQTCITCAIAKRTVDNSWGWAKKLPKTSRVSYQNTFGK